MGSEQSVPGSGGSSPRAKFLPALFFRRTPACSFKKLCNDAYSWQFDDVRGEGGSAWQLGSVGGVGDHMGAPRELKSTLHPSLQLSSTYTCQMGTNTAYIIEL